MTCVQLLATSKERIADCLLDLAEIDFALPSLDEETELWPRALQPEHMFIMFVGTECDPDLGMPKHFSYEGRQQSVYVSMCDFTGILTYIDGYSSPWTAVWGGSALGSHW